MINDRICGHFFFAFFMIFYEHFHVNNQKKITFVAVFF